MTFQEAVEFILAREGGFQIDPEDSGNWTGGAVNSGELKGTNMGISAASYPNEDIRGMTRERAIAIYKKDYWDKCRCGDLPHGIDLLVMDSAVNQGPRLAIRMLQKAVRVTADGIVGPTTIKVTTTAGRDGVIAYAGRRMYQYGLHPKFSHFGPGWSQRLMECLALALK